MAKKTHPIYEQNSPLRGVNSPLFAAPTLGRREFFKVAGTGVTGFYLSSLLDPTQTEAATVPGARLAGTARNVIFILMNGAPSHIDTFDLKVGSWTPADFNPTDYNGVRFPQGLMPTLAGHMDKLMIIRSLRAPALVHGLQQTWVQIARNPTSGLSKIAPNIGSVVALEMEKERRPNQPLPGFVSLNTGGNVVGSGYFSAKFVPFDVIASPGGLTNLANADGQAKFEARYAMMRELDDNLRVNSPIGGDVHAMDGFYAQSRGMMYSGEVANVFRFTTDEQTRYGGNNGFANSCVTARNMLKANLGTRYIQINIGGWDNHSNIYVRPGGVYAPATTFDRGLGALVTDLAATPGINGGTLLDETLIVAMGEFGRTCPTPNNQNGRDHYFQHFCAMIGGGVSGGRTVGESTDDGRNVKEPGWSANRPVANEDIAATIYSALGIDYTTTRRDDPLRRGFEYIPFADEGVWEPVMEVFGRSIRTRPRSGPRDGGREIAK